MNKYPTFRTEVSPSLGVRVHFGWIVPVSGTYQEFVPVRTRDYRTGKQAYDAGDAWVAAQERAMGEDQEQVPWSVGRSMFSPDGVNTTVTASIGPVGRGKHIIHATAQGGETRIKTGCRCGTVEETIERVQRDYANDPLDRDQHIAAVRAVAALVTQ